MLDLFLDNITLKPLNIPQNQVTSHPQSEMSDNNSRRGRDDRPSTSGPSPSPPLAQSTAASGSTVPIRSRSAIRTQQPDHRSATETLAPPSRSSDSSPSSEPLGLPFSLDVDFVVPFPDNQTPQLCSKLYDEQNTELTPFVYIPLDKPDIPGRLLSRAPNAKRFLVNFELEAPLFSEPQGKDLKSCLDLLAPLIDHDMQFAFTCSGMHAVGLAAMSSREASNMFMMSFVELGFEKGFTAVMKRVSFDTLKDDRNGHQTIVTFCRTSGDSTSS